MHIDRKYLSIQATGAIGDNQEKCFLDVGIPLHVVVLPAAPELAKPRIHLDLPGIQHGIETRQLLRVLLG